MRVRELVGRHEADWGRATRHPFLDGVRDGTLSAAAFDGWLVQDYLFVGELLRFQARLLSRAGRGAQEPLAAGLVALAAELSWFTDQATRRGLDLGAAPRPATVAYLELLGRLDTADVAVGLAMLWVIERVYLEAWSYAAPGAPGYDEFVAHWTAPGFAGYVRALELAADEALREHELDAVFTDVVAAECRFWQMALDS